MPPVSVVEPEPGELAQRVSMKGRRARVTATQSAGIGPEGGRPGDAGRRLGRVGNAQAGVGAWAATMLTRSVVGPGAEARCCP